MSLAAYLRSFSYRNEYIYGRVHDKDFLNSASRNFFHLRMYKMEQNL